MIARLGVALPALVFLGAACPAMPQSTNPGHVNYIKNATTSFDTYTTAPDLTLQQWLQAHFAAMIVYPPYFDSRLSWFSNVYAYKDLYGIATGSWTQNAHPDWILHDQYGNWLYIPYGCGGGTCTQYAADIANPAFRAAWIDAAKGFAGYPGLLIDDVNMQFRVSDGWGNAVAPVDSNTGQPMTYDAWRNYVAAFLEQIRAAFPSMKIMENAIWYAGPAGVTAGTDPQVQRQIATTDAIMVERGVASDPGLSGGTGPWSLYSLLNYVDLIHAAGKAVNFQEYTLDTAGLEYGLASYFLISTGNDGIGDLSTTPDNWWSGYDVDLGAALGPRSHNNGVFERDFAGGKVLLGEPGLPPQNVDLGGTFTRLDGTSVTSVTVGSAQGFVLQGAPASQVVNAASLSGGSVSPGEIVSLFGSFPTPPSAVAFDGTAAPILFSTSSQVNVAVPFALNTGQNAAIQIQSGQATMNVSVPAATASPAIFTLSQTGTGSGAILNQDYSVNGSSNPASAGSVIMIYGTGFGALSPLPSDGKVVQTPATTQTPVTATINGVAADVVYAGAAPGLVAGVVQVNVRVPDGLGALPSASIRLTVGSFSTQAGVTVAIQ